MQKFYAKIMKKPKAYRRKLAYALTIVFGLLLFSLWMFITFDDFEKKIGNVGSEGQFGKELPSLKEKYQEQIEKNNEIKQGLEKIGY